MFEKVVRTLFTLLIVGSVTYCPTFASATPPQSLAKVKHWAISQGMTSHTVTDLLQDPYGFLWIATRNGLQCFDGTKFKHYLAGSGPSHLPSNHITSLWFDKERLWISTTRGIAYYDYQQHRMVKFPLSNQGSDSNNSQVDRIISSFDEHLLALSEGRVWRLQEGNTKPVALSYNGETLHDIDNIHQGERWIWLAQSNGDISVWDGSSNDVFKVTQQNPITDTLPAYGFNHILSRDEHLWFSHDQGMFQLDDNLRLQQQLDNNDDLATDSAIHRAVYIDDGHLFLGTADGIRILETPDNQQAYLGQQHSLKLPAKLEVTAFTVDHLQRLWLGAENGGLYQFSQANSALDFERLVDIDIATELNTMILPEAVRDFSSVERGLDNYWWFTTSVGLIKYDQQQQQIIQVHPLPTRQEATIRQMKLFAERLFITTKAGGLFVFDIPEQQWLPVADQHPFFSDNELRMAVQADKIWIANSHSAVAVNEFLQVIDQKPLLLQQDRQTLKPLTVNLQQQQQTLTLDFVSPLAPQPENVQYRYRLYGLENAWQYTTRPLQPIAIQRIPADQYLLQIQASTDGNDWQLRYQQEVTVTPPWWQSAWAYAFYAALIVAVGVLISYWVRQNRQRQQSIQQQNADLAKVLDTSGTQVWDWHVESGELYRHNLWLHCPQFPIDGIRNGLEGTSSNIHPQDIKRLSQQLTKLVDGSASQMECSYRLDNNGHWLWLLDRAQVSARDNDGKPTRIQGAIVDISSMINSEERLNMLALSLTNISDGICIFDRFFRKREVNKAYETITGFGREQALNQPLVLSAYDPEFTNQIKRSVMRDGSWRGEIKDIRADGSEFQMELTLDSVTNDNGELELIVASFSDVTERLHTENELRRLSNTDSLTGLPNRSYFQVSHSNLVRKKVPHTLLVFDLDDFKKINDSLGHEVGDELLCRVAERLTDIGRRQDTLYRLGGDEFGLLVEDTTDINTISALANQINKEIAHPYQVQNHEVVIGSSIGIVLYPHDASTSQELLQKADTAMYHAKQRRGNCYQFFSQSMNENAIQRLQTENELRSAIREDRVEVHYQPKIEVPSQHIAGIEALARIRREDGSLISPAEFIPLAEETGLIVPLGEQVLRIACRDMLRFLKLPGSPRNVAINLSARQFLTSSLAFQIENILTEEGLHPRHVEFEITEGMVMTDPERAITMLENLADMGVQLALDDFGTGYSSLAYLKRFPIHTLKIDKAFVDDITSDDKDRNMVASIIAMAHNLTLKVVAEGVESKAQLEILKTLRCEYIQGFYFAKPMQADQLIRFIEQHQIATTL